MTTFYRRILRGSALALAVASPQLATAQINDLGPFLGSPIPQDADRGRNVSVTQRPRPEYDPIGIRVGGFTAYPSLELGIGYSDNIFAAPANTRGDAFFAVDPQLRLVSNWSINRVALAGGLALRRFADNPIKNETGYFVRAEGNLDVDRDSQIVAVGEVRRAYQAQFSSAAPDNALRSVAYVQSIGVLRGYRQFGQFKATLVTDVTRLNFSDLPLLGGVFIDQDFRDSTVVRGGGRLAYAITPAFSVFGETNYSGIIYDRKLAGGLPNRDGRQLFVLGGASLDVSALIRAHVGLGYIRRTFDAPGSYRPISGLAFDGRLEYFVSGLTTLSAGATRSIEESIVVNSSGYFSSTYRIRADHELLRNLILYGQGELQNNTFEGVSRRDKVWAARAGGTYLSTRNFNLLAGVSYLSRTSAGLLAGQAFDEWRGTVSVVFRR